MSLADASVLRGISTSTKDREGRQGDVLGSGWGGLFSVFWGIWIFAVLLVMLSPGFAQESTVKALTGEAILERIDANSRAANRVSVVRMVIHSRRASRSLQAKSWVEGRKRSFTEYLAPAREKGTKMLKLEDQLWIYSPETDRTIRISGHLLRQSVMGSDLSYEDLMEDPELRHLYQAEVVGEEMVGERPCWVLELTAREGSEVAYQSRRIWVDRERFLPLREERFAKSGKLLKTTEVKVVMPVGERWVIRQVVFKDALKEGEGTELYVDQVEYDVEIPEHVFSKANLRK